MNIAALQNHVNMTNVASFPINHNYMVTGISVQNWTNISIFTQVCTAFKLHKFIS